MKYLRFQLIARLSVALFAFYSVVIPSQLAAGADTKLVAVVIGNSAYKGNRLPGPDNDAKDIAKILSNIGFQISNAENVTDLNRASMYSILTTFIGLVDKDTVAVVYYSGHGLEDSKENFLVPIDASLSTYADVQAQLIPLDWILTRLGQREARTKIVILDACRNMPQALRYKSLGEAGGLAEVKKLKPGTLVVYAASPESVAMSAPSGQRNSVFTGALLAAIAEKHTTFSAILNRAAELTLEATNNTQYPWLSGNPLSFNLPAQLPSNPLSQERTDLLPRPPLVETRVPDVACEEISEQTVINGVSTWTKRCL